jgi:hypothetical protein
MVYPIVGLDLPEIERVDAFKAPHIVPVLIWVRPTLMVCINAADRTEVMLGCHGVELI